MASRGRSIQWRIMAWLLPLLALVFAAVMFWLSTVPRDALYADNLETVRRASRAAIRASDASMLNAQGGHPWAGLRPRIETLEGAWIRIVGAEGQIAFSTDPTEMTEAPDLERPSCAPCHDRSSGPFPTTAIVPGPEGAHFQVLATPLPNRDECRGCHTEEPNIGILLVGQSIEPIHRIARSVSIGIAMAGGIALLLTLLTTRIVLGRLLGRPLRTLVKGAEAIGAGDLSQPIDLGETTELTVLADTLNLSTARLAGVIRRVEQQRDESQTLYHFTDQISRAIRPEERRLRAVELATQFLGAECVLVQADYQPESKTGQGTITLREGQGFEDQPFRFGPDEQEGIPPFLSRIIERWLEGEFDETTMVKEGWIVGYPVQHEGGRHLGLLLLPVDPIHEEERDPPDPDLVRALCRHIAIAIEFSAMQTELVGQERLAAIGETIAGLAHCLKNALNALRAGLYITDRALEKDDPEKLRRGWRITKVGIQQIEGLSLDMLYYVKERKPERKPTNPNRVVEEVVALLGEMAADKDVELRAELDEKVRDELLDHTTIYRAILNLVTNAIDACTEVETGNLVVVRTLARPDEIVLTVEDNGVGMTDDIRSRLFTRFFSTKGGKGTGLGLAVVKKIVEEHGGRVEIESTPGRGSRFRLCLPRSS